MQRPVLILSNTDDPDTDTVHKALEAHGELVFRFDTSAFAKGEISLSLQDPGTCTVTRNGVTVDLSNVKSVWYRRPKPIVVPLPDERHKNFAKKELTELFEQLYVLLPNARWVSRPYAIRQASHKFHQLEVAQAIGFRTPETCMTNSAEVARAFVKKKDAPVVYKPLRMPGMSLEFEDGRQDDGTLTVPTTIIEPKHMESLERLPLTGGIFQEYIDKEYELRITVIGDSVFAAKIDSQASSTQLGRVDGRYDFERQRNATTYQLPDEVSNQCRALVKKYGLEFAAIDIVKSRGGGYVFLEINPNGQWVWLDRGATAPLLATMVNVLSRGHS